MTTLVPPTTESTTAAKRKPARRWLVLGIGVVAQASFATAFQGLPATGTTLRDFYHLSNTGLGWVMSGISLGIAATEVIWGILTDRVGERRILIGGLAATGLFLALMATALAPHGGFVPGVPLLTGAFFLTGALGGSVNGASGRAVMGWFGPGERSFAMSVRQTAVPLGGALGAAVLPLLAVSHGFTTAYGFLAALCGVGCLLAFLWLRDPTPEEAPEKVEVKTAEHHISPLRRGEVWRVAISGGLFTCPQFAMLTFSAVYLHDVHHLSIKATALAIVTTQIIGGATRVILGWCSDRFLPNRIRTIRIMGFAAALVFAAVALLGNGSVTLVTILLVIGGTLGTSWHGVAYAEIAEMAGKDRSATALGMENTMVFVGAFIIPIVIAATLRWGWQISWWVVTVTCLAAALILPKPRRG